MSNEEDQLFGSGSAASKPKFGEDRSPEKTARQTAAAMAAMDVEGLVGDSPKADDPTGRPRSLANLFDAPQPAARPAPQPTSKAPPRAAAPAAKPSPRAAARPTVQRSPSKPPTPAARAGGATHPAVESPASAQKRGLLARLFGWILGR